MELRAGLDESRPPPSGVVSEIIERFFSGCFCTC
jgi:hypothetical protein